MMEDSGIDSDQRNPPMDSPTTPLADPDVHDSLVAELELTEHAEDGHSKANGDHVPRKKKQTKSVAGSSAMKSLQKTTYIHKKIERQREAARKSQAMNDSMSRRALVTRNRLPVPSKGDVVISSSDMEPLVMIDTDESEDEFSVPGLSLEAHREITQQLIKDGYNLDLEPDDEDLDLIPPRPLKERYACCPGSQVISDWLRCSIQ